jgi:hypothetical protein
VEQPSESPENPVPAAVPQPAEPPPAAPPPAAPPRPVSSVPTGPVAAADMRASDADRDRVAQILRTAFEEGRLTIDEHSERIEALYAAKTMGELEPLTFDLPVAGRRPDLTKPRSVPGPRPFAYRVAPTGDRPAESPSLVAVFGSAERKGPGRIGARLRAAAVFGGIEIDLSEATFESPTLVIHVATVFGGIDVRVPEGVTVRGHGAGIFGAFEVQQQEAEDPDAPVVIVKGAAVFGGVDIRPKRTKGWRKHLDRARDRDDD